MMSSPLAPGELKTWIAHVDDVSALARVLDMLRALHGELYRFTVGRWDGDTAFATDAGESAYRFLIDTENAAVRLRTGDRVRGAAHGADFAGRYDATAAEWAEASADCAETLWPGDVLTTNGDDAPVALTGSGLYFQVTTRTTDYRSPRLALLRGLPDLPGGCAAYPGAFRREALPPQRTAADAVDQRGANRVNEHTLDMRIDRTPTPIRHYHGTVPVGGGRHVNHSETAIVLPRSLYDLPEVDQPDQGHLVLYPNPADDPTDKIIVPVRPGSIVVTPATSARAVGHCFENVFAMLIAIPGFVAPYNFIEDPDADRALELHTSKANKAHDHPAR